MRRRVLVSDLLSRRYSIRACFEPPDPFLSGPPIISVDDDGDGDDDDDGEDINGDDGDSIADLIGDRGVVALVALTPVTDIGRYGLSKTRYGPNSLTKVLSERQRQYSRRLRVYRERMSSS